MFDEHASFARGFAAAETIRNYEGTRKACEAGWRFLAYFFVAGDTKNAGSVFEQALPGPRRVKAMDGFHKKVSRHKGENEYQMMFKPESKLSTLDWYFSI